MTVICWLKTIYRTIRYTWLQGIPMMGHDYVNEEEDVPALVTTTKCKVCGHHEVLWERTKSVTWDDLKKKIKSPQELK